MFSVNKQWEYKVFFTWNMTMQVLKCQYLSLYVRSFEPKLRNYFLKTLPPLSLYSVASIHSQILLILYLSYCITMDFVNVPNSAFFHSYKIELYWILIYSVYIISKSTTGMNQMNSFSLSLSFFFFGITFVLVSKSLILCTYTAFKPETALYIPK
jgi:hypothetical protein